MQLARRGRLGFNSGSDSESAHITETGWRQNRSTLSTQAARPDCAPAAATPCVTEDGTSAPRPAPGDCGVRRVATASCQFQQRPTLCGTLRTTPESLATLRLVAGSMLVILRFRRRRSIADGTPGPGISSGVTQVRDFPLKFRLRRSYESLQFNG